MTKMAMALLFLALTVPAQGALSGDELQRYCSSVPKEMEGKEQLTPEELSGALFCAGYLTGFTDAKHVEGFGRKELYCIPEGVDNGRLAQVVLDSLKKNPERVKETARVVVIYALKEAFPCGKSSNRKK